MRERRLFVRFTKIDEEKREVAGRLTQEIVDRDGEIWDYASSVPHIKAWSASVEEASDGKSVGNLRAMHRNISAGKLTHIEYNDAEKAVDIVAKVVDDAEWEKAKEGVYTGFSIGGNVVRSWRDAKDPTHKRFEVAPVEASLADYPCVPTATFSYVKTGGSVETRSFKKVATSVPNTTEYADETNKKLPLFNKTMTRAALAIWGQPKSREGYSEKAQDAIGRKIRAAATKHGIEGVTEKAMLRGDYSKSLYDVSRLADLVQSLAWLQESARYERESEDDDSTVPDQLCDHVAALLGTLQAMLGEEGDELLSRLGREESDDTSTTESATMPEQTKTATGEFTKAMATKHVEKLGDIHTAMKAAHTMLGDACEKIAGFTDEVGGQSTTKVAGAATGAETIEKVAKSEFDKVAGERDEWKKRFDEQAAELATAKSDLAKMTTAADELAEGVETLTKAVTVRKGALIAVDKTADGVTTVEPKEKTASAEKIDVRKLAENPGEFRKTLHGAFKNAFRKPSVETGLPADAR